MFDDIFDRNWELAILVHEQFKLLNKGESLTVEENRLSIVREKRIKYLLIGISQELPNWQVQRPRFLWLRFP